MNFIFVDTSAWCAYFDKTDAEHTSASQLMNQLTLPLITSNYIIDETLTLIQDRMGHHLAIKIGKQFFAEQIVQLARITIDDETAAFKIFNRYADKNFSFTDCTSFALMERLKVKTAFAFDEHFAQFGTLTVVP